MIGPIPGGVRAAVQADAGDTRRGVGVFDDQAQPRGPGRRYPIQLAVADGGAPGQRLPGFVPPCVDAVVGDVLAMRDGLTGLFNRRAMQQMLDEYEAERQPLTVIALDIDHFKAINDRFGHDVGDAVIVSLATLMQQDLRSDAALCRSGGEEFLLLLPGVSLAQAQKIAERLRTRVASHDMEVAGHITISLGVAHWGADATSIAAVLKEADKALYDAKSQGRNCVVVALG